MIGPITVDISIIAGGAAIAVSIGNIVWLYRLEDRAAQLRERLRKIEARSKRK
jgi:hypothetical protein